MKKFENKKLLVLQSQTNWSCLKIQRFKKNTEELDLVGMEGPMVSTNEICEALVSNSTKVDGPCGHLQIYSVRIPIAV